MIFCYNFISIFQFELVMNFLFAIFSLFFKKQINIIKIQNHNIGYNLSKIEQIEDLKKFKRIEMETKYPIGDIFISICNEWESMSIVEITGYFNDSLPVGLDILTGKEYTLFSNLVPYSEKAVLLLKKLDPYERYALNSSCFHYLERKDKIVSNVSFEDEPDAETIFSLVDSYLLKK